MFLVRLTEKIFNLKAIMNFLRVIVPFVLIGLCTSYGDWNEETAIVSKQKNETVVKRIDDEAVLFSHSDPQLSIEWSLANNINTIVLGGEYIFDDRVDVPRAGVNLIVDKEAIFKLNPDTQHTTISFKASKPDYWGMIPLIYNKGHNDVQVLISGHQLNIDGRRRREDVRRFP